MSGKATALDLARAGLPVFPCRPTKAPYTSHGFKNATCDEAQISDWWDQWPAALVGVPTGEVSGLDVLDIDPAGFAWYEENAERLAPGRVHRTARNGYHLLYRAGGLRNSASQIAPGVDVRGDGGFIIWWPAEGCATVGDLDDVTDFPSWLLEGKPAASPAFVPAVQGISEGGRNDLLSRRAYQLKREGLAEDTVLTILRAENAERCNPPLGDDEVRRIVSGKGGIAWDRIIDIRNERETARRFIAERYTHKGEATLLHWRGDFYAWDGCIWQEVDEQTIKIQLGNFLETCRYRKPVKTQVDGRRVDDFTLLPVIPTGDVIDNVTGGLKGVCQISPRVDPPHYLGGGALAASVLVCRNGVLNLETGELTPHEPALFVLSSTDYVYDPAAQAPAWAAFIASIWPDDAESRDTLQELLGLLLTAETRFQKIFLLYGVPRSGKGTILRLVPELVGRSNVAGFSLRKLAEPFSLSKFVGKGVAFSQDARLHGNANVHAIAETLLAVSGEDLVEVNRKYRDEITCKLGVRFVLQSNEIPRIADASNALASRFIILRFSRSFAGTEDQGLDARLASELPGVLNWALEGWRRLKARGYFIQPKSGRDAVESMREMSSPVSDFVGDCLEFTGDERDKLTLETVRSAYGQWASEAGLETPSKQTLSARLQEADSRLYLERVREDGARRRYFKGVRLSAGAPISTF